MEEIRYSKSFLLISYPILCVSLISKKPLFKTFFLEEKSIRFWESQSFFWNIDKLPEEYIYFKRVVCEKKRQRNSEFPSMPLLTFLTWWLTHVVDHITRIPTRKIKPDTFEFFFSSKMEKCCWDCCKFILFIINFAALVSL